MKFSKFYVASLLDPIFKKRKNKNRQPAVYSGKLKVLKLMN